MQFNTDDGPLDVTVHALTVAGWTGRDLAAVQHHIDELAAIGVAPPSEVPLFYRVSNTALIQAETIEVLGDQSSGEAEPMVLRADGRLWLGLASDHTDRALETFSVAASKQVCAKPCAADLWPLDVVKEYLDEIEISSEIFENGGWVAYQAGTLAQIRPLEELIAAGPGADGSAMLCGTFAAVGGVRPSSGFRAVMTDRRRSTSIMLEYHTRTLPIVA